MESNLIKNSLFYSSLLIVFFAVSVFAETRNIYGIDFVVDIQKEHSPGFYEVVIGKENKIIAESEIPDFIISHNLKQTKINLTQNQYITLLKKFIGNANYLLVRDLFAYAAELNLLNRSYIADILPVLKDLPSEQLVDLINLCRKVKCNELTPNLVLQLGVQNLEYVKSQAALELIKLKNEILNSLDLFLATAIRTKNFSQIDQAYSFLTQIYHEDKIRITIYRMFNTSFQKALVDIEDSNFNLYYKLTDSINNFHEIELATKYAFHDTAIEIANTKNSKFEKINISLWNLIDPKLGNSSLNNLVKSSLQKTNSQDLKELKDIKLVTKIVNLAEFDSELRSILASKLSNFFYHMLKIGDYQFCLELLKPLEKILKADSLDSLKIDLAEGFLKKSDYKNYELLLVSLKSDPSLIKQIKFFVLTNIFKLLIFTILIFLTVYFLYFKRKQQTTLNNFAKDDQHEDEDVSTTFKMLTNRVNPNLTEYQNLMSEVGLPKEASLRAIKSRYRSVMKDLHPDTTQLDEVESASALGEVKKKYDRIFSLRKELGLDQE